MKRMKLNAREAEVSTKKASKASRSPVANVNKKAKAVTGSKIAKRKGKTAIPVSKVATRASTRSSGKETHKVEVPKIQKLSKIVENQSSGTGDEQADIPGSRSRGGRQLSQIDTAEFQEGGCNYHMSVDAPVSDHEENMSVDSSAEESIGSSDDDSEYETDSMKIRPMTQEDRLHQMEEIDNEMTEKLTELRDIMAEGGMTKSTQFLEQHFLG